jgi:homoserine/homoserine lactone efflux protein
VRRTYWTIIGLEIGLMTQFALVAVGLGAALATSVPAFNMIKWLGVVYLIYLAIRQWRTATFDLSTQLNPATDKRRPAMLLRGSLVNLTTPTGLVFLLAVLPQFVVPAAPLLPQYLIVGATMVVVDLVVMGGYAALAARPLRWLHTPRQQTVQSRVFSGLPRTVRELAAPTPSVDRDIRRQRHQGRRRLITPPPLLAVAMRLLIAYPDGRTDRVVKDEYGWCAWQSVRLSSTNPRGDAD